MAEEEIKIPIKAEADTAGFTDTTKAAEEMQQAVEAAATETAPAHEEQEAQVRKVAAAKQAEKKASEEAAAAEAKLRREMELAKKSRNELIIELQRLAKERQNAAKSGDAEAFERLTRQSAETREAFEKLNQGLELTNIKFIQQAQMGMMAGQTLGNLGQIAEGGAGNFAAMAAQVLSLGQAIKAGLGPIGWAMMLLQGLQMAWDYFADKQEKARKASEEAQKAIAELNETLLRHADAAAKAAHDAQKSYIDERVAAEESAAQKEISIIARRNEAMQDAADHRLAMLRAEVEGEKQVLAAKKEAGEITAAQYKTATEALDAQLREMERKEAESAEVRTRERLNAELRANEEVAKARSELAERLKASNASGMGSEWTDIEKQQYAEIMAQYKRQQEVIEARKATVAAINKQMEAERASENRDEGRLRELRRQRAEAERDMIAAQKEVERLDFQASMQFRGIMNMANDNEEARHLTGVALLEYAHTVNGQLRAASNAADKAWEDVEAKRGEVAALNAESTRRKETEAAQDRTLTAEQKAAAIAEEAAERERKWADVQLQALDVQQRWLAEQMKQLAQGSELWRDYEKRLRAVNEKMAAERVATLTAMQPTRKYAAAEARTQEEILDADRALLTDKLSKLRAELSSGANLTPALRKSIQKQILDAERQLAGIASAEVKAKLASVTSVNITQQYQLRDARTQRQKMEADAAILTAKRAELRKLASTPGLDAATQTQINAALKDTERQIQGLNQAWQANRAASSRWLRELQPPRLQAKNKMMQKSLDATAAAYARTAKQAERAAAKGDTKALDRYRKRMQQLATTMDRRAKDGQAGTRLQRQADDALRGISRQQVATERAGAGSARAARRKQRADEQAASSAEKGARDAKRQTGAARQTQVQKLTGELAEVRAGMARMEAEHQRLLGELSKLSGAVTSCANTAAQTATLAGQAASATAAANANAQKANAHLQKQIDRIKRKL